MATAPSRLKSPASVAVARWSASGWFQEGEFGAKIAARRGCQELSVLGTSEGGNMVEVMKEYEVRRVWTGEGRTPQGGNGRDLLGFRRPDPRLTLCSIKGGS